MKTQEKIIIYQVFTRLFGNGNPRCKTNGSLDTRSLVGSVRCV